MSHTITIAEEDECLNGSEAYSSFLAGFLIILFYIQGISTICLGYKNYESFAQSPAIDFIAP